MNLEELDDFISALHRDAKYSKDGNKELIQYYTKERKKLVKKILKNVSDIINKS